jgi:nucleoside-diphosphate-sugar epimerase
MANRLAVTGANGFVGRALCAEAIRRGIQVRGITRLPCVLPVGVENVVVGNVDGNTDWTYALEGCDVVVHLAARVHIMRDTSQNPLAEFRSVNTQGSAQLARSCVAMGVKRLVNVSSVGVNGASTPEGIVFAPQDTPDPHNPYSLSKNEAELALKEIALNRALEVVTVRPPLIYGPGVGGNFFRLLRVVQMGIPLPLALTKNHRDLLYVGNLVDFLLLCAHHPAASGNTYLVSDGVSVSTNELLRGIAAAFGVPSRLFPFPLTLLQWGANMTGHMAEVERLLSSLRVDNSRALIDMGWNPPHKFKEGLQVTVDWYRDSRDLTS